MEKNTKTLGFASLALLMLSTQAFSSELRPYGKINYEYASFDQSSKNTAAYRQSPGAINVGNSESRIGLKGSMKKGEDLTIGYAAELGLNSNLVIQLSIIVQQTKQVVVSVLERQLFLLHAKRAVKLVLDKISQQLQGPA